MKFMYMFLISIVFVSCGSSVALDYEKGTDWSQFTAYQFSQAHAGPNGEEQVSSGLNELDDKRVMRAVDSVFQARGYQKTDYNQFYIDFFVEEYLSNSRNTIGIGLGSGGRNVNVGGGIGIPIGGKIINQRFTLEFYEADSGRKLLWQAIYDGELKEKATPAQKDAYYFNVVSKMLKKYPPEQ